MYLPVAVHIYKKAVWRDLSVFFFLIGPVRWKTHEFSVMRQIASLVVNQMTANSFTALFIARRRVGLNEGSGLNIQL